MIIKNIQWDYNLEDEVEDENLIHYYRHCPGAFEDAVGLPNSVEINEEDFLDEDGELDTGLISDWLFDEYGFCHYGFEFE